MGHWGGGDEELGPKQVLLRLCGNGLYSQNLMCTNLLHFANFTNVQFVQWVVTEILIYAVDPDYNQNHHIMPV